MSLGGLIKNLLGSVFLIISFLAHGQDVKVSLAAFYQTQTIYRGAQIWPVPSAMIGPSVTLFEKISLRGPSLTYSFFPDRDSPYELSLAAQYFSDSDPLINFSDHKEDYRNQRKDSLESQLKFKYKFGYRQKFYLGLFMANEYIAHKGFYSEWLAGAPIAPFTSLNLKYSIAAKETNQFLYGPEGVGGTGFYSIGLSFVIPFVPWDGIIINTLDFSHIIKESNQNADYVRSKGNHLVLASRWIWNAF